MWTYTYTDELYHHGVKGMKWGVRKKRELSPAMENYRAKKTAYKQAKRDYNKSFNKAYNKASAAYSPFKKHRQANDERWNDVYDKAKAADKAQREYKDAKNNPEVKAARQAKMRKAAAIGAAAAATALVAYGGYKLHQIKKEQRAAGERAILEAKQIRQHSEMGKKQAIEAYNSIRNSANSSNPIKSKVINVSGSRERYEVTKDGIRYISFGKDGSVRDDYTLGDSKFFDMLGRN